MKFHGNKTIYVPNSHVKFQLDILTYYGGICISLAETKPLVWRIFVTIIIHYVTVYFLFFYESKLEKCRR